MCRHTNALQGMQLRPCKIDVSRIGVASFGLGICLDEFGTAFIFPLLYCRFLVSSFGVAGFWVRGLAFRM